MAKISKKYIRVASQSPDSSGSGRVKLFSTGKNCKGRENGGPVNGDRGKKDSERKKAKVVHEVKSARRGGSPNVPPHPRVKLPRVRLPCRRDQRPSGISSPAKAVKHGSSKTIRVEKAVKKVYLPKRRPREPALDNVLTVKYRQQSRVHRNVRLAEGDGTIKVTRKTTYGALLAGLRLQAAEIAIETDLQPSFIKSKIKVHCLGNTCPVLWSNWHQVKCLLFVEYANVDFEFRVSRRSDYEPEISSRACEGEKQPEQKDSKSFDFSKLGQIIMGLARRS